MSNIFKQHLENYLSFATDRIECSGKRMVVRPFNDRGDCFLDQGDKALSSQYESLPPMGPQVILKVRSLKDW